MRLHNQIYPSAYNMEALAMSDIEKLKDQNSRLSERVTHLESTPYWQELNRINGEYAAEVSRLRERVAELEKQTAFSSLELDAKKDCVQLFADRERLLLECVRWLHSHSLCQTGIIPDHLAPLIAEAVQGSVSVPTANAPFAGQTHASPAAKTVRRSCDPL